MPGSKLYQFKLAQRLKLVEISVDESDDEQVTKSYPIRLTTPFPPQSGPVEAEKGKDFDFHRENEHTVAYDFKFESSR